MAPEPDSMMRSRIISRVRLAVGLAIALIVPPVLLVTTNQSIPVHAEWWMIAIGAAGLAIVPGPLARLLWLVPYVPVMLLILSGVAMSRACALGACV